MAEHLAQKLQWVRSPLSFLLFKLSCPGVRFSMPYKHKLQVHSTIPRPSYRCIYALESITLCKTATTSADILGLSILCVSMSICGSLHMTCLSDSWLLVRFLFTNIKQFMSWLTQNLKVSRYVDELPNAFQQVEIEYVYLYCEYGI